MKSDMSVDPKYRPDYRQGMLRRRTAKISYGSENSAFENDLALALQESLKYAKQSETENRPMEDSSNKRNMDDLSDSAYISSSVSKKCVETADGTKQLKELLMLHIDLVQHQQELLIQKDKEIGSLVSEREALKCRLDRMERRMSLLKQKDDMPESPHRSPQVAGSNVNHQNARTPQSESKINTDRGVKRKTGLEPQSLNKRFAAEAHKQTHKNERSDRHEKQTQRRHQKSCTVTSSSEEENQDVITFKKDNKKLKQKQVVDNTCLRTDDSYYVSFYKPISDEIDTMSRGDILKQAEGQLEVEVPTWKIQKYNKLWVMEGTENLEDEIFLKRHQKPEVEEKRRKRWDLQRMREQSIYQKLKDKEEKCPEGEESNRMESFYPLLDDITHIEVCDEIPVMAFGHTLPNIESNHFSLPWELEVSRQRCHSSRSANTRSSRNK